MWIKKSKKNTYFYLNHTAKPNFLLFHSHGYLNVDKWIKKYKGYFKNNENCMEFKVFKAILGEQL